MATDVAELKDCMDEASAIILDDFVMGVDGWKHEDWIVYPNRYMDERGKDFWEEVEAGLQLITDKETAQALELA